MGNVAKAITNTVSISQFNKGMAGQIFADVKKSGAKVVMKNNTAEAVIVSTDDYLEMVGTMNDLELYVKAVERMNDYDPSSLISEEDMMARFNITDIDLMQAEEVEFE